jgi:hypothetical protein
MTEELSDLLDDMTDADFDYPEHAPQWIPAGSARICGVCGALDLQALEVSQSWELAG